jgi:hypothetical protein
MRTFSLLSGMFLGCSIYGQVEVAVPVVLSGPGDRQVIGLASPAEGSAMISVAARSGGTVHWATPTQYADTIQLALHPAVSAYSTGLLLRFLPLVDAPGGNWLRTTGLSAYPIKLHDGSPLPHAMLRTGEVAEVLFTGNSWILISATSETCPPGALAVNARLCMDRDATPGLRFYQAIDRCGKRGGKLCTWDEYVSGCFLLQDQLTGLFDAWEWIDDTANHTHTANQVARFTCEGQRSANVITTMTGDARCCYRPR